MVVYFSMLFHKHIYGHPHCKKGYRLAWAFYGYLESLLSLEISLPSTARYNPKLQQPIITFWGIFYFARTYNMFPFLLSISNYRNAIAHSTHLDNISQNKLHRNLPNKYLGPSNKAHYSSV